MRREYRREAAAKINFNLAILGRREDGYHELLTCMQSVGFSDLLIARFEEENETKRESEGQLISVKAARNGARAPSFARRRALLRDLGLNREFADPEAFQYCFKTFVLTRSLSGGADPFSGEEGRARALELELHVLSHVGVLEAEDNILWKSFSLYFQSMPEREFKKLPFRRLTLFLVKRIPFMAGLGGGSADAAALLSLLHERFPLPSTCSLDSLAQKIGADVPFCLSGGTKLCGGTGEKMEAMPSLKGLPLLILKPKFSVRTSAAFLRYDLAQEGKSAELQKRETAEKRLRHMKFLRCLQDYVRDVHRFSGREKAEAGSAAQRREREAENVRREELLRLGENDFYLLEAEEDERWGWLRRRLLESGAYYCNMTGSGSAFFALYADREARARAYRFLLSSDIASWISVLVETEST